jgi:hypothetical protein
MIRVYSFVLFYYGNFAVEKTLQRMIALQYHIPTPLTDKTHDVLVRCAFDTCAY